MYAYYLYGLPQLLQLRSPEFSTTFIVLLWSYLSLFSCNRYGVKMVICCLCVLCHVFFGYSHGYFFAKTNAHAYGLSHYHSTLRASQSVRSPFPNKRILFGKDVLQQFHNTSHLLISYFTQIFHPNSLRIKGEYMLSQHANCIGIEGT